MRLTAASLRKNWRKLVVLFVVYLILVALQLIFQQYRFYYRADEIKGLEVQIGATVADGFTPEELPVLRWKLDECVYFDSDPTDNSSIPVVLLHGTPGSSFGFSKLADHLATSRRVIWMDLPGFGAMGGYRLFSFQDLSPITYAEYINALLERLNIDHAHIVGWSNGGATAAYLAHNHPTKIASITFLASVGAQETEGSGNYHFEHAKYDFGEIACIWLPYVVPPFAAIPLDERYAFIKNFQDTDQREVSRILPTIDHPSLILHGRNDFLTADWAAEYHHELMPTSTLIMTPYDHFMPFMHPKETAKYIEGFISRFDDPSAVPVRETLDLAPRRTPFGGLGKALLEWVHFGPWVLVVLASALTALILGRVGQAWIVVLMGASELDIGLAWVSLSAAMIVSLLLRSDERKWRAWLGSIIKPGLMLGAGFFLVQLAFRPIGLTLGEFGWTLVVLLMALVIEINIRPLTREGRLLLDVQWKRLRHHEWWPTWALHWVALPSLVASAFRHRHPLVFTCCNPGIDQGGGFAGESKIDILRGLLHAGSDIVLYGKLIDATGSPSERAKRACTLLECEPRLGGYPIVLKPNQGENGRGLKICRSDEEVRAYFKRTPADVLIQKYHPGPHELGVFWVRAPRKGSGLEGGIFSICRKEFPLLECDGLRTIGELIDDHPRYRVQRDVFRARLADRLSQIPAAGDTIALSPAGNHKQGAIFHDAPDLLTPELEAAIDRVASAFTGPNGGGLDFGRFDVRYDDESELRQGRGLAIIELNGVTSETINIYDPNLSVWFAWRILRRQWRLACELGAARKAQGVKPMSVFGILFGTRRHLRGRRVYAPAS